MLQISVVIPLYNAAPYLEKCVQSVLIQPEVDEILLVDDGSKDGSYELAATLQQQYPQRIRLLTHPNRQNCGTGATRNVGIKAARNEWIAFLDSDDFYLPQRFAATRTVIEQYPDAEGVYEALGTHFEVPEARDIWQRKFNKSVLTTIEKEVSPEQLFPLMIKGMNGHFSGDALTVRKSLLEKVGYYAHSTIGEDTHLHLRLAMIGKLYGGNIKEAVALRRVHLSNTYSDPASQKKIFTHSLQHFEHLLEWSAQYKADIPLHFRRLLFARYVIKSGKLHNKYTPFWQGKKTQAQRYFYFVRRYPELFSVSSLAALLLMLFHTYEIAHYAASKIFR
ncbi:MAG: glycosyltransferase family 2 protein [Sphingobacteriales bacterium]|nr:glycosyltransferase family 2 protein [Sphingobacteriales bacterium]